MRHETGGYNFIIKQEVLQCNDVLNKVQDYQKLVDGYQNHHTDVKMARRLSTKYHNYFMYIFDAVGLVIF